MKTGDQSYLVSLNTPLKISEQAAGSSIQMFTHPPLPTNAKEIRGIAESTE